MPAAIRLAPFFSVSLLLLALSAVAQEPAPEPAPETEGALRDGFYVVRPGDTLEGLAERYLGDAGRWREIWRLNAEIDDPNVLAPGQEIRMLWRRLPDDGAVLAQKANRVEDRQPPADWREARERNLLRPRDSVRTYQASSAELVFGDRTRLTLSEESAVTLDPGRRGPRTVDREQVELVAGQADLQGEGLSRDAGIELLIGDAAARPKASADGTVETRARKAGSGNAQLMVYRGESDLAAGGASVPVAEGMGSQVPEGGAPTPPETLLDAPALVEPAEGAGMMTPRPAFAWSAVDGAASYTVEICADAACVKLVRRVAELAEASWRPSEKLPKASYFWRVTATAPSGLDGYPSSTRALEVLTDDEDTTPPTVAFAVSEPRVAPRWGLNQRWILGPGARFASESEDPESGVERWIPFLDDEEVAVERWQAGPWTTGETIEASFAAVDRAGNRTTLDAVPFVYDDAPPRLTWGVEKGAGPLGEIVPPAEPVASFPRQPAEQILAVRDPHSFWPWRKQKWLVERDPRHIVLRPNRPVLAEVEGREVVLTPERGLWILAEDPICLDLDHLEFTIDLDVDGSWPGERATVIVLRLEAEDLVTNAVQGEVSLRTLGKASEAEPPEERREE